MKNTSKIVWLVVIVFSFLSACSGSKKSKCNTCPKWSTTSQANRKKV